MTRVKAPKDSFEKAKEAALNVLLHNHQGPFQGLPRTAAYGYPEPYTRDLMIAGLGVLASGHPKLVQGLRRVLKTLARNQSELGHIPSLVHDPRNRGASDCTPLFLMTLALYRRVAGEPDFLQEAAYRALTWMRYQSPTDQAMVAQMPTTDWRDEQWVLGFGLYVNSLVHIYLQLYGQHRQAAQLKTLLGHPAGPVKAGGRHFSEGLALPGKPYYALWAYKVYCSDRFDLLGNSLAILSGMASRSRAEAIIRWVESSCEAMRERGELRAQVPPNLFPFIRREDPDWLPRYEQFNRPGEYHNGGIWPFICGFYIAAAVAAGRRQIAARTLDGLTELVKRSNRHDAAFGFNEWHRAESGEPAGQDGQTWSAAMYLYAAACVEKNEALFFSTLSNDAL